MNLFQQARDLAKRTLSALSDAIVQEVDDDMEGYFEGASTEEAQTVRAQLAEAERKRIAPYKFGSDDYLHPEYM